MGADRGILLAEEQCLEPPCDPGAEDLWRSFAIQIHYAERTNSDPEHLQIPHQYELARCDHQLPTGRQFADVRLFHLVGQGELQLLVETGSVFAKTPATLGRGFESGTFLDDYESDSAA